MFYIFNFSRTILINLKLNPHVTDGLFFNLSANDLGSSLKTFMYEFNHVESLIALDLSDNSKSSKKKHFLTGGAYF